MVEIPVTGGHVALVDDSDGELTRRYRWNMCESRNGDATLVYARARVEEGSRRTTVMHAYLTGWPLVDHINGNGLDNRRINLRPATYAQNGQNRRKHKKATSRFKGVSRYPFDHRRWKAAITYDGRDISLGVHESEDAAALAYDAAARAYFGEFAALNFPGPGERSALLWSVEHWQFSLLDLGVVNAS